MTLVFTSEMGVELIDAAASDASVVRAARVSTVGAASASSDSDAGLINYLVRERHGSPFEHNMFTFLVHAPIFVWREHMRHRIASYNEESGRYRQLEPVFYIPGDDRRLVQVGKTGHYEFIQGSMRQHEMVEVATYDVCQRAYDWYRRLLDEGVAREVARMVLPVSIYSSAYVTMNARALMNFISLRKKSDDATFTSYPQREIEMVAEQYEQHFAEQMPLTYAAFVSNGRVAP